MNMANKLDAIRKIIESTELCAEAMVSEIETILNTETESETKDLTELYDACFDLLGRYDEATKMRTLRNPPQWRRELDELLYRIGGIILNQEKEQHTED